MVSATASFSEEEILPELHALLQYESFLQAAVIHGLFWHGSLPWSAVLQECSAPAFGVTSPAQKPAPAWAPLSIGPEVLLGPPGLPTRS